MQIQWPWLLGAAAVFIVCRVAFFQSRIWYLERMRLRWKATVTASDEAEHLDHEDMPRLQRVLIEARVGIEGVKWPITEPAGYGFVAQREMSLVDNLCYQNEEVAIIANAKFGQAIGAYRMRRNDTLNPIQWVIALWNLPRGIAMSLGADEDGWPVRLLQVIYQLGVVAGLVVKAWSAWQGAIK